MGRPEQSVRSPGGRLPWGVSVAIIVVFYAVALAAFGWAGSQRTATPVLVVGFVVAVSDLVLRRLVRPPRVEGAADLARRLGWPLAAAAIGAGAVAVWAGGRVGDGWGALGAMLLYFGAGQALTEVRASMVGAPWRGPAILSVCGVAIVTGLTTATSFGFNAPVLLLLGGALTIPIGLSLLTEDLVRRAAAPPPTQALMVGVGGVLVVASGILLVVLGVPFVVLAILTGVLFVLVAAIASNNETDVIIVVSVVVLVWSLAPRDVALGPPVVPAADDVLLVAMGDSFMSGEGARRYYEGTNVKDTNECRRAPTAAPVLMASRGEPGLPTAVVFVACSGARAEHLVRTGQYVGEPVRLPGLTDPDVARPERLDQARHVQWILEQLGSGSPVQPALVMVSVGGNDALFSHIATTCLLPGDCSVLGQRWLDQLAPTASVLDAAAADLRAALGPDVPVLVMPYPNPINPTGCSASALTASEHRFLHGFTTELNALVTDSAARAGFHVLAEMETTFADADLRLCDAAAGQVGVNFLAANPVTGLIRQRANPLNWFHNSLHPNARGHEAMADTMAEWIRNNPSPPATLPPPADPGRYQVADVSAVMGGDPDFDHCGRPDTSVRFCDGDTDRWRFRHTAEAVRLGAAPVLTLALGCWLVWLAVIHRSRRTAPGDTTLDGESG